VQSQVKAKMFSTQAAEALKAQLSAGGEGAPQPPAEAWEMLLKGETSVDSVKEFVKSTLTTTGALESMVAQVLGAVEALAEQFPAPVVESPEAEKSAVSSASAEVSKTVEVVDPAVFKAGLVPSKASQPIRSWEEYMAEPERKDLEAEAAEIKAQTSHL
jgi:hypothetical protein